LIDPHTAVGMAAAELVHSDVPVVVLSTAHAAKFPDAVRKACGTGPVLPHRLAELFEKTERFQTLPADAKRIRAFVSKAISRRV
jgi:threonine synthase